MSSSSEATSARPCAACRRLGLVCLPNCVFARNFSTHGTGEDYQFAVLHNVFGAGNIAKLLAELELKYREAAIDSVFVSAVKCQRRPDFGRVSFTSILRGVIGHFKGANAAAAVRFEDHVGQPVAPLQQTAADRVRLEWETLLPGMIRNKYAFRRELREMAIRREQERQVATQQEKVMTTTQQQLQLVQYRQIALQLQNRQAALNVQTALQELEQLLGAEASASEQETQEKMDELDAAAAGLTMEQYYAATLGLDDVTLGHGHPHLQQEQAAADAPPFLVQEQEQPTVEPTVAEQLEASLPPMTPTLFEGGGGEGESSSDSDPPPDGR